MTNSNKMVCSPGQAIIYIYIYIYICAIYACRQNMTIQLFQKGLQSSIPNYPQKMESPAVNCLTFPNICGKSVVSSTRSWAMVPWFHPAHFGQGPFRGMAFPGSHQVRLHGGSFRLRSSAMPKVCVFFSAAGSTCFLSTKYLCKCLCSCLFFCACFFSCPSLQ